MRQKNRPVREHHQCGKEQHRPQADQSIHQDGDYRLGLLVMRLARGVIGLHQVAAGGAEQKRIEKMRHEGNLQGPAPRQLEALHAQHRAPARDADQQRRSHQQDGKPESAGIDLRQVVPEFGRAFFPAALPLLPAGEAFPGQVLFLRGRLALIQKNVVEKPPQQHQANPRPPAHLPDSLPQAHSWPHNALRCATPCLASSGESDGLNSKTFRCCGFTWRASAAKSIMPVPGARWSRPGNCTS